MAELTLTRDERLALRGRAHHLNPVVLLGAAGLTEAVLKETDRALLAHELIKLRVPGDDRDQREAIALQIADRLGAARVQVIGKLLVLYRPRPLEEDPSRKDASSSKRGRLGRSDMPPATGKARAARPTARKAPPRALTRRGGGRGR